MYMCFRLLLTLAFSHIHPWCQTAFVELNNWFSSFTCLKPKMVYTNDWSSFVIWNKQTLICVYQYLMAIWYFTVYQFPSIEILAQYQYQCKQYLHINLMSVYCLALTWLVSQLISKLLIYKHHLSVVVAVHVWQEIFRDNKFCCLRGFYFNFKI